MTNFLTIFAIFLFLGSQLCAQTWVRGALYLHAVDGEVALTELGGETLTLGAKEAPLATSGLVNCVADYGSSAFFSASNRSHIFFEGDGSFAVERFEQIVPDPAAWKAETLETDQSRMIINFRAGTLIVDNRNMVESSQCLIETPLGRLTVKSALWQMNIAFDPRSQIFDFTITCSSGRVRFTDLQGQQYTLRSGQRLAGAGSRSTPSIEVGENTDQGREQMERYYKLAEAYIQAGDDLSRFLPGLQTTVKRVSQTEATQVSPDLPPRGRRPIVIEHATAPDPVTPFRGELAPPTLRQADLF